MKKQALSSWNDERSLFYIVFLVFLFAGLVIIFPFRFSISASSAIVTDSFERIQQSPTNEYRKTERSNYDVVEYRQRTIVTEQRYDANIRNAIRKISDDVQKRVRKSSTFLAHPLIPYVLKEGFQS